MSSALRCSECRVEFPRGELIDIRGGLVCATCKPIALQRVDEYDGLTFKTAGVGVRFAALFCDGIVLMLSAAVVGLAFGILTNAGVGMIVGYAFYYLAMPFYNIYFLGKNGATPGKKLLKIKVIRMDGSPLGYGLATGRFFAYVLSFFTFYIGFIIALFDKEYARTLHDRICKTRVIYAE